MEPLHSPPAPRARSADKACALQFPSMNTGMGMDMGFPKMHFPKFPKMTAKDFAGGSVLAAWAL